MRLRSNRELTDFHAEVMNKGYKQLITISPNASLLEASVVLVKHKVGIGCASLNGPTYISYADSSCANHRSHNAIYPTYSHSRSHHPATCLHGTHLCARCVVYLLLKLPVPQLVLLSKSVSDLGIGTYENILTMPEVPPFAYCMSP